MSLLIGFIVALAVLTTIVAATAQHTPVSAMLQTQARTAIKQGIAQADAGMGRYVRANLDVSGQPIVPPPGTDLAPLLVPTYMFLPAAPRDMQWAMASSSAFGMPAFFLCLLPSGASRGLLVFSAISDGTKS